MLTPPLHPSPKMGGDWLRIVSAQAPPSLTSLPEQGGSGWVSEGQGWVCGFPFFYSSIPGLLAFLPPLTSHHSPLKLRLVELVAYAALFAAGVGDRGLAVELEVIDEERLALDEEAAQEGGAFGEACVFRLLHDEAVVA